MNNKQRTTGFTIVELLIVVVVIAILAAITIVSYNGIQTRSKNTATIQAVNNAVRAITSYIATTNTYPTTTAFCVTPAESGSCAAGGSTIAPHVAAINSIKTVATLPSSVPDARPEYNGIVYNYGATRTFNGTNMPAILLYSLTGEGQSCGVANTTNSGSNTMLSGNSAVNSNGYTVCVVSIQGPPHS